MNFRCMLFVPTRQSWDDEDDLPRRTIEEAELHDVSIVTTPAYSGTEIGLRSLERHRKAQKKSQAARRMRMKARQSLNRKGEVS
jgi:phage head maturation protease